MIYLVVLSALYALHLLLKLHWITTVVIGGFAASDFRTPEMVQKKDRIREKI